MARLSGDLRVGDGHDHGTATGGARISAGRWWHRGLSASGVAGNEWLGPKPAEAEEIVSSNWW
jgi:hypothetical protein